MFLNGAITLSKFTNCLNLQFSSIQSLSHVWLFATLWTVAHQASLSIINSRSLLKLMCVELVMPSNHLILCYPFILLPPIFPSIRVLFPKWGILFVLWKTFALFNTHTHTHAHCLNVGKSSPFLHCLLFFYSHTLKKHLCLLILVSLFRQSAWMSPSPTWSTADPWGPFKHSLLEISLPVKVEPKAAGILLCPATKADSHPIDFPRRLKVPVQYAFPNCLGRYQAFQTIPLNSLKEEWHLLYNSRFCKIDLGQFSQFSDT